MQQDWHPVEDAAAEAAQVGAAGALGGLLQETLFDAYVFVGNMVADHLQICMWMLITRDLRVYFMFVCLFMLQKTH